MGGRPNNFALTVLPHYHLPTHKARRVLETRLQNMADIDAKASSLKVGGKYQEVDLEASTAQV
jgi:homoserine kinase